MKLKTYFSPKVVRAIAVSLLLLALAYAAVTILDVMRPAGEQVEKVSQQDAPLPPSAPMPTLSPQEQQKQMREQAEKQAQAAKDEAEKRAQDLKKSAEEKKIAEEKAALAKEEMGETVADTLKECREENKEWFACKTDKECVEIRGACGARDAAKRDFRTEVEDCNRLAAVDLKCGPFAQWRIVPRCVEGVCIAQKQEAKPASKTP